MSSCSTFTFLFRCIVALGSLVLHSDVSADETSEAVIETASVSFNQDIRPLLSSRCFACHGPDAESREADLRLDQPDGEGGAIGLAIEPGSADHSELWNRITSDDDDIRMPPSDSNLAPLTEQEQALIRAWIEQGAAYEGYWAFDPPQRPKPPSVRDTEWSHQSLDHFVLRKLEANGVRPSAEATARTLLRRLSFDLIGLPPTREEIREFVAAYDKSPDSAWEKKIDQLVDRPEFGEHMARYWLDLVRFADSNGMHKDFYRNNVAYRDWVIRAFNENLGYDDFLRYQLAGDQFDAPTKDQLVASGFNRLHLIIDRGTALPEESHVKNVIDRVTAVGTAFMGLTVQCAQCHDHKFDPITQRDFYSLYAFFNNIDAAPETEPKRIVQGLQEPYERWPTNEQSQSLSRLSDQLSALNEELNEIDKTLKSCASEEGEKTADTEKLNQQRESVKNKIKATSRERDSIERGVEKAMVMRDRKDVRDTFVLVRGQYDNPGERVVRDTPKFLPTLKKANETATRLELAEWFVAENNPLTARVAVNRFWQVFFGVGLIKTAEDFGNQGDVPSHPELLDELAVSFVESGWDVKALVKRIALSKAYRQVSRCSTDQFKADPENRLLARGPRYRLDAEIIRDQILATSGSLSQQLFGPSVKPPQPDGLWKAVSMIGERFKADQGDAIYRRSVYTFWKRGMPPPQMTIMNAPIRDACIARRERTNTSSQALLLLNESEYMKAAGRLARKIIQQPRDRRIAFAWETVTCQLPDVREHQIIASLLDDLSAKYEASPGLATKIRGDLASADGADDTELAAWTVICNTLYNLDIVKTKE